MENTATTTIPASGLRIYDDAEALALGRAAATAVLTPINDTMFAWQWVRYDGGMDFFRSDSEAAAFLDREYPTAIREAC